MSDDKFGGENEKNIIDRKAESCGKGNKYIFVTVFSCTALFRKRWCFGGNVKNCQSGSCCYQSDWRL